MTLTQTVCLTTSTIIDEIDRYYRVFRASVESGVLSFESISNIPAGKYNFYSLEGDTESLVIIRNSVHENQHSYLEYSAYSIDENE